MIAYFTSFFKSTPPTKPKRKTIPKSIREQTWDKYVGKKKGTTLCFCCDKKELRQSDFHAGHIIAEAKGGLPIVKNLRPICRSCNLSMGTMNMYEYKNTYRPHR